MTAIALYKQIASDDSGPIGAVARLRAAWALADTASRADLADLLTPLDQPGSAWRENGARSAGLCRLSRHGTCKSALANIASLASDPDAPDALRNRAQAMAAFLQEWRRRQLRHRAAVPRPPPPAAPAQPPRPRQRRHGQRIR